MFVSSAIVPWAVISPELHEVRVIGEPADDVQVVLDDAHGASLLAHGFDQVEHRVDPLGVDARRGLVEQQHLGLGGQHTRQRDELGLPVRQGAGRHVGEVGHADEAQPVHRLQSRVSLLDGDDTPVGERQRGEVLAGLVLHRHHHVLEARQPVEQPHVLERAHQALARHLVRVEPDQLVAVQLHRAGVGRRWRR